MDAASVQAAYSRWSKVYDGTFGVLMSGARRRAVGILDLRAGENVLEVGVGTGLSLSLMPAGCRLTGVDFSRPMLERALPRVRRGKLACRAALVEADGARLPFADSTFDAAIAPFVVSATPDPAAVLREMVRVCRPGGRLLVLNHFTSRSQFLARIEQGLSPVTSSVLGFLDFYLIVHAVDRLPPGVYYYQREARALELLREGDFRSEAGRLGLSQELPADAAANIYCLTDLDRVLAAWGNRGYRAAQLEGGIRGGRMYLAAYAQRFGATGLTFFDEEVVGFFSPHAHGKSVMFLVAVGHSARRSALVQVT